MSNAENTKSTLEQPTAAMASPRNDTTLNVKRPHFLGMRGKTLGLVVSIVATTGFMRKSPFSLFTIKQSV